MKEERGFLRAFKASFDPVVLLVFADWLEERGDGRAMKLRVKLAGFQNGVDSWKKRALEGHKLRRGSGRATHEHVANWFADLYRWVRKTFRPGWKNMGPKFRVACLKAGARVVKKWREQSEPNSELELEAVA